MASDDDTPEDRPRNGRQEREYPPPTITPPTITPSRPHTEEPRAPGRRRAKSRAPHRAAAGLREPEARSTRALHAEDDEDDAPQKRDPRPGGRDNGGARKSRAKAGHTPKKTSATAKSKKTVLANPLVKIGAAVVAVALIAGGVAWWLTARNYEDTDDAFIDTHIIHVAPQITGQVTKVAVDDNAAVHAGDVLVVIDSADADAKLKQVQAQELQAEVQLRQATANMEGASAQADNARRDLARYRELQQTTPGAVSQQQIDQAAAAARNTAAQRDVAREQISAAGAQIDVYKAQIAAAQLNLNYTTVTAPNDARVAQHKVAVGDYVVPGQQIMDLVPPQFWVTANFKETQLIRMHPGQEVEVKIDSCGVTVPGHIESVQSGAGQAFGLLPPENATGNFVKVVQRVPVKITLDRMPDNCVLGPGMSVEPRVKVR